GLEVRDHDDPPAHQLFRAKREREPGDDRPRLCLTQVDLQREQLVLARDPIGLVHHADSQIELGKLVVSDQPRAGRRARWLWSGTGTAGRRYTLERREAESGDELFFLVRIDA